MTKTILAIIIFAFALAASGVHKLAHDSDTTHFDITIIAEMVDTGVNNCCDSDEEDSNVEKPRCLSDNCLFSTTSIEAPYGHREKIGIISSTSLADPGQNEFLRPPIG